MLDLKHNDYEEMCIDNSIDELLNSLDTDTLILLYFYAEIIKSL